MSLDWHEHALHEAARAEVPAQIPSAGRRRSAAWGWAIEERSRLTARDDEQAFRREAARLLYIGWGSASWNILSGGHTGPVASAGANRLIGWAITHQLTPVAPSSPAWFVYEK
ncbi:hypothetical protein BS329_41480 [Amycolatopsis coloradensis]|uniref:Uncharacterized protein n=1 Tax=Amycolatopsis coloradensis TaxID=76021 RepID=A0A1R0KD55_9PSEU|nr:hypothetical protein [Amycolatopsis coloradensis]OLZ42822.1 hypothetical protein BS329_41480 [Amycolatopsis coloradensis]